MIFDADSALADIERDGHRVVFNAAFAEHGVDINWRVEDYGRLLAIPEGPRRVAADLRAPGFGATADVLAGRIYRTKAAVFGDCVLDGDIVARAGLVDLVMSLFVAEIWVGVVSTRRRAWVEALVRQLVGDGLVETIVTVDDLLNTGPRCNAELYRLVLSELGITPRGALAIAGSRPGLRAARAADLAAVVITTGYTADEQLYGAAEVRPSYAGADPLLAPSCQLAHRRWWITQQRSRAA
ncbi:HAD family hydrolase [Candidatus Mycobacterium methanotrophicum]|uniref:HAD family hydrolase n=1 Tax=Candidatus Mycobacterium methanotrophicum TaxID=2943498 RepID=A0ABY4QMA4_9MYCO|nr:HAD family hydrolase [Candidatus Mycobacterium methanotrophicum]UQX11642.1 HAD family hydrolase [Candidatus Mycobacterium methanotrophicum]